jgi:hypothetical protein
MFSFKLLLAATAVGALAAGTAVGALQPGETTPVTAEFHAALTAQHQRQCDARHLAFRLRFEGTFTSADPRLTGDVVARVRSVLDTTNQYGSTSGIVLIRDHATGRLKFVGRVVGVLEPGGGSEGFLDGRTTGPSSAHLLANFNAKQDPATGALTGELGKDTQTGGSQDPAVLTSACGA